MARIVESRPIYQSPRRPTSKGFNVASSLAQSVPGIGPAIGTARGYTEAKRAGADYESALARGAASLAKEWASKKKASKQAKKGFLENLSDKELQEFMVMFGKDPAVADKLQAEMSRRRASGTSFGAQPTGYQPQSYQAPALMSSNYQLGDYGGGYQSYSQPSTTSAPPALSYYSSPDYQFPTRY